MGTGTGTMNRRPIRKVRAGGAGGLAATVLVLVLEALPEVAVPSPAAALLTLLASAGLAYAARSGPGEAAPPSRPRPPDVRLP